MTRHLRQSAALFFCLLAIVGAVAGGRGVRAVNDLRRQIEAKTDEIQRLEAEAEQYRVVIEDLERTATTLQAEIRTVDRAIQRLGATIKLTNAKIARTNLEIEDLDRSIASHEGSIEANRQRLRALITLLADQEQETPLAILMKHETVSAFFTSVDQLLIVQTGIQETLGELRAAREELRRDKVGAEAKRFELNGLAEDLADQKALQEHERRERTSIFDATKNQERRYQELLADVERRRDALQQEITALEADLATDFDRSLLPQTGSGVLGWPLERLSTQSCWGPNAVTGLVSCITQFFGRTSFARSGAYRGQGHNGVDFRAAAGTPVYAGEQGSVRATGNTDAVCARASYGQWILIDHPNNLATLYAHLSLTKVRAGDAVNRGELIGYSGRTGYATGPHLHFTVFANQAVTVGQLKSRVCKRTMTLPLSPFGGYLNPLDYL